MILDAQTTRRIRLQAQVKTVCDTVALVETGTDALAQIRKTAPDVVIVAHDLPELKLNRFCKALRANPQTQLTTIIVAVPSENHSARVSALIAGAHDLIEYTAEPAELRARLRNVMRSRQMTEQTRVRAPVEHAGGFAEAPSGFAHRIVAQIVSAGESERAEALRDALPASAGLVLHAADERDIRRDPGSETDVYILLEASRPAEARDLLGALRSHPGSCHSRILFVSDAAPHMASPLDLGAHDHVPCTASPAELALRIRRLARLKQNADRERESLNALGEKAYTDRLTGLNNRGYADEYLQRADRSLAEHPAPLAILLADVDHFKKINDNHGHEAGDRILAHIAGVLKANLRGGDTLARYGGEEFLIVLPNVGAAQARCIAERLRKAVSAGPAALEDGTLMRATISIGIALTGKSERKSTADLRRAADTALYRAKGLGRNRIEQATPADFIAPRSSGRLTPHRRTG
nr:diguanylate cyclase [Marivita sp. GX14005]